MTDHRPRRDDWRKAGELFDLPKSPTVDDAPPPPVEDKTLPRFPVEDDAAPPPVATIDSDDSVGDWARNPTPLADPDDPEAAPERVPLARHNLGKCTHQETQGGEGFPGGLGTHPETGRKKGAHSAYSADSARSVHSGANPGPFAVPVSPPNSAQDTSEETRTLPADPLDHLQRGGAVWWSLADHVELAKEFQTQRNDSDHEHERWRSPLFWFAYLAAAHPTLGGLTADDAAAELVRVMGDLDPGGGPWAWYENCDRADVSWCDEAEMLDELGLALGSLRLTAGDLPLAAARRLADAHPLPTADFGVIGERRPDLVRLVSLCWWLAALSGGGFYLSKRTAADALGVSDRAAWRYLVRAVELGWLEVVRRAEPGRSGWLATEYRFTGADRVPLEFHQLAEAERARLAGAWWVGLTQSEGNDTDTEGGGDR